MSGRLTGKTALITGAGRGLGRYCALGYAAEGATVIVAARSASDLDETVALIAHSGGTAHAAPVDVADPDSIAALVRRALAVTGRLDVVMANAAHFAAGGFSTVTPADWEQQFRVNVHGVFHLVRAVVPVLAAQGGGHVITVSSVAAHRSSPYGVTKRVVEEMTLGFAAEQREAGIAVNALRPVAAIATPGWLASRSPQALAERAHRVSPPDSYVEAAILLATQPGHRTGALLTDADVIREYGAPGELERFRALNAPIWASEGITA
ncbi:SDR family NAD(P)-dependent oxidoreductase [Cryptosporangium sp. NPDC048952]|uniref:SDR family NAD(P)-dependent oxidoreductase n=1 Tax=Cryptosporangium sp. NPDC048952 TaxID=3363961 RepID=UPI003723F4F8